MARDLVIPVLSGLPPHPGRLPSWMMLVAGVSILNGLQNYVSLAGARKVYNRAADRVSPLQSRTFGTWTITAGLVRLYAAYNISNPGGGGVQDGGMGRVAASHGSLINQHGYCCTRKDIRRKLIHPANPHINSS
ncbi:hypothetical protein VP01_751g8 [Puccinia sorghi]|uniref:Uncharacterized protein n=1 Tax=Puccinia sorghi TaxID=27349 RepID=A0A0L6UD23_9BASI|nr:hypothetical protein VP01_751g8 [Puccinia sorghi]